MKIGAYSKRENTGNQFFSSFPKNVFYTNKDKFHYLSHILSCAIAFHLDKAYFLTSAEVCEKSSPWLWKESCINTGVRKPGNTCASLSAI